MESREFVLGIWDGHDSGAALVAGGEVLFAINEERLTRRKLEIHFPKLSILACLQFANLSASQIRKIAYTTTDFAKTLTRTIPRLKEDYYQIRRRKAAPSFLTPIKKNLKYRLTEWMPTRWTHKISDWVIQRQLTEIGFSKVELHCVDHHTAHAAGALLSGFDQALVLTLDGIGDGLSGAFYRLANGQLKQLGTIPGADSLGIFYEHVTNLMNMRELEDEGKVMALANFAYPVPDDQNPMLRMIQTKDQRIQISGSPRSTYRRLREILWQFPAEQFCYMAQRTLESRIVELVKNLIRETELHQVVLSGGVASNIKANRLIRNLAEVKDLFVFPHMGDGGQALGAACYLNNQDRPVHNYRANEFLLGPDFTPDQIETALKKAGVAYRREQAIVDASAELIARGEFVFWFQGRMEYGPRALGARSILALPGSLRIKDALNLKLKRRVWYQPFCPSVLESEARDLFEDLGSATPDRYMTTAYQVRDTCREKMIGVLNVDGTCRPQIVADGAGRYAQLLLKMKALTGLGVLLNTSMNIHGEPLACTPEDAIRAFLASGAEYLVMEDFLARKSGN
jgi:carbamoyltransferase